MSKLSLQSIKSILFQILPVMLGVYLGLLANNWNEEKKSRRLEQQILIKIKAEIEGNKKQIEANFDYHKMLLDTATAFYQTGDIETFLAPAYKSGQSNFWRGTRTSRLKSSAYQASISSGVFANLDIDLITLLSELYAVQEDYAKMSNLYLQKVIDLTPESSVFTYLSFVRSFSQDIYYQEKSLLKLDKTVLEKLKENNLSTQ